MKAKKRALLGQLSDMDIRLLNVFKSVVECGGMSAAELELNIGTSTISRHVKDLETRLGLSLCRRGRGGFGMTPEGEQVYAETLRLFAATHSFRTRIDDIHQRMSGPLHLSFFEKSVSNPKAHIPDAIALFRQQAPNIDLNVHVGSIQSIERGVLDGELQIGIIPAHRHSNALSYQRLFAETMLLYAGQAHPLFSTEPASLGWRSLQLYALAGLGFHSPNMNITHRHHLNRSATGFDQEAVAALILSGAFLGFLPDHYAQSFVKDGLMRAIKPRLFRYPCRYVGIVRRSPQASRVTLAFLDCLEQVHRS
jgi:DNA-binding transcriptional LysR family regulator